MTEFTEDEIRTVLDLIYDWGFEYNLRAESEKVRALEDRLKAITNEQAES